MADDPKLSQLLAKLELLLQKQASFAEEIEALRQEIQQLKTPAPPSEETPQKAEFIPNGYVPVKSNKPVSTTPNLERNLESYIGENLISKIGIIVLVLGVAIGVKYVIDHNLISPLVRIILGYLVGVTLLGLTYRLKSIYLEYSIALASGAVAILYFTTLAAYTYYAFYSFPVCFGLMLGVTIFTVFLALYFNRAFVAYLGLLGAYVLPFLLQVGVFDNHILSPYMALVNVGILTIAIARDWKGLNVFAFIWTWLLYLCWYLYPNDITYSDFVIGFMYLSVFFSTFCATFLAYKLYKLEVLHDLDVVMLSCNAFMYFIISINLFSDQFNDNQFSGLIASANAAIHFLIAYTVSRQGVADPKIARFLYVLGLCCLSAAIPLQFDDIWTVVFWSLEAGILFAWGRIKQVSFLEIMAYVALGLAGVQVANNWILYVYEYPAHGMLRILNANFSSSFFFVIILAVVNYLHDRFLVLSPWKQNQEQSQLLSVLLGTGLVLSLYFTFFCEISAYWIQADARYVQAGWNQFCYQEDLESFRWIWSINYTLIFIAGLVGINWIFFNNREMASWILGLKVMGATIYLWLGLYLMNALQHTYKLDHQYPSYLAIPYVSMLFFAVLLGSGAPYLWRKELGKDLRIIYEFTLAISILYLVSNEIILLGTTLAYKLGLSLWWGIFALILVVLGIWKRIAHVRIAGMVLFGATLLKLFFYDIAHLATIPKTIIFIALGVLLLLVSYLYNRYKDWLNPQEN